MSYKKFINRNGKAYGPYIYESKRDGGKVVSHYQGKSKSRNNFLLVLGIILIIFSSFLIFNFFQPTGKIVLEPSPIYSPNETIYGDLRINLKHGELLPSDSLVSFKLNDQEISVPLSQIALLNSTNGDYYAEDTQVSGQGEGYGFPGEKRSYPEVYFKLLVYQTGIPDENGPANINKTAEKEEKKEAKEEEKQNKTEEKAEEKENKTEEKEEKKEEDTTPIETPVTPPVEETNNDNGNDKDKSSKITGKAITTSKIIDAKVSGLEEYIYELRYGESISLVQGSVKTSSKNLSDDSISISANESIAIITTSYYEPEFGFGGNFLNEEGETLMLNLESLEFHAEDGTLEVSISYNGNLIAEAFKKIRVSKQKAASSEIPSEINESIPQEINDSIFGLIKQIPDILIGTNKEIKIDLDNYFSGADSYEVTQAQGLELEIKYNVLTIKAGNVSDVKTTRVTAFNGENKFTSNDFNIIIQDIIVNKTPEIEQVNISKFIEAGINLTLFKEIPDFMIKNQVKRIPLNKYFYGAERYSVESVPGIRLEIDKNSLIVNPENTGEFIDLKINAYNKDQVISSNLFKIKVVDEIVREKTIQSKAVIGKPVRWEKIIQLEETKNISVELPLDSQVVSVNKLENNKETKLSEEKIATSPLTGQVTMELRLQRQSLLSRFFKKLVNAITGKATQEVITEGIVTPEGVNLEINDKSLEYSIEYETPAPEAFEKKDGDSKIIKISGPDEVHYQDVLAYSNLNPEIEDSRIKMYHLEGDKLVQVNLTRYDLNENGLIDYVEWNVPKLSSQTYALVIEISRAEHLDSEKNLIEDIFSQVIEQDDNWTETINNGEYVRVNFERNLTSRNDITVFARDSSSRIEVYEKDSNISIATISNIKEAKYYKTLLTSLGNRSQAIFDLKILGQVQFDHIIDPDCSGTLSRTDCSVIGVTDCYLGYTNNLCSWSVDTCYNTASGITQCSDLANPQACDSLTGYGCSGYDCTGTISSCGYITDYSTCGYAGCDWGYCTGSITNCNQIIDQTTCNALSAQGCNWGYCYGSPMACAAITTEGYCTNAGCSWSEGACTGMTSFDCGTVPPADSVMCGAYSCNYNTMACNPYAISYDCDGYNFEEVVSGGYGNCNTYTSSACSGYSSCDPGSMITTSDCTNLAGYYSSLDDSSNCWGYTNSQCYYRGYCTGMLSSASNACTNVGYANCDYVSGYCTKGSVCSGTITACSDLSYKTCDDYSGYGCTASAYVIESLPAGLGIYDAASELTDFSSSAQSGAQSAILKKSGVRIATMNINFDGTKNFGDIDGDYDASGASVRGRTYGKSFVSVPASHTEVSGIYLRVPATQGTGIVYVCPDSDSMMGTYEGCASGYYTGYVITSGYYNVPVTGTGIVETSNTSLVIWDQKDSGMPNGGLQAYSGNQIKFYANYSDRASGFSINGTNKYCNITFNDTSEWKAMDFNSSSLFYEYNRSFITSEYIWNVSCNDTSGGYEYLSVNDTLVVTDTPSICPNSWVGAGTLANPCNVTACGNLSAPNFYYKLVNSISDYSSTCFGLNASYVHFDLNNLTVDGSDPGIEYGVGIGVLFAPGISGADVRGGKITDFNYGIWILDSSNNTISDLNASSNMGYGIWIYSQSAKSEDNQIINSSLRSSGFPDLQVYMGYDPNGYNFLKNYDIGSYKFTGDYSSKVSFENSSAGIVKFLAGLATTDYQNTSLNIDVKISNNSVSAHINSTYQALNVSANVTLYGIGNRFSYPVILRNNIAPCNDSSKPSCHNFTALNANTVIFNVSSWSNYSIGEDPNPPVNICPNSWLGEGTLTNPCNVTNCGSLSTANLYYKLVNSTILNYNSTCFTLSASNVNFDLNSYTVDGSIVQGDAGSGIYIPAGVNGTVTRGGAVTDFGYGIYIFDGSNNSLIDVAVSSCTGYGMWVYSSPGVSKDNQFINSSFTSSPYDVQIMLSSNEENSYNFFKNYNVGSYYFSGIYNASLSFENSSAGIVKFLRGLGTDGFRANLNNEIKISNNSVYVNSTFQALNSSANVTLYGIGNRGFTTPVILRNNIAPCNESSIPSCHNFTSLVADTVIFNVSSWSNYSIGEDPNPPVNICPNSWSGLGTLASPCLVTTCGNLSGANLYYQLVNSTILDYSGTCFTLNASNVNFDLNSYTVDGNDAGGTAYGLYLSPGVNNTSVRGGTITDFNFGLYVLDSSNNTLNDLSVSSNLGYGIWLYGPTSGLGYGNQITNSSFSSTSSGVDLQIMTDGASYNFLKNYNAGIYAFSWENMSFENTSAGIIKFLGSLGAGADGIPRANLNNEIIISNNSVYVNSSLAAWNVSANVTLYGIGNRGFTTPVILRNNIAPCNESSTPSCYNFTSLVADTVIFNVSSWSNYSIGEDPNSPGDATAPTVSLIDPANHTYNITANLIDFSYNVSDASSIANCSLIVNNKINKTSTSITKDTTLNITSYLANANYMWTVNCTDNSGNVGTALYGARNLSVSYDNPQVSECKTLSTANQVYTLTQDVSTTGHCFTIAAHNVTLNLNGFNITGDGGFSDRGVSVTNYNAATIKNGVIYNFGNDVYFSGVSDSVIRNITFNKNTYGVAIYDSYNNTIIGNSFSDAVIVISSSSNNTVISNVITNNYDGNIAIYFESSAESNNISYNNISNIEEAGIYAGNSALYNIFSNNNITNIGSSQNCIYTTGGYSQILSNFLYNCSGGYGVYADSTGNLIQDNIITKARYSIYPGTNSRVYYNKMSQSTTYGISNYGANSYIVGNNISVSSGTDVYLGTGSTNTTFLNTNYTNESIVAGNLIRQWYLDLNVTNVTGQVASANVSLLNRTSSLLFSELADSSGLVSSKIVQEYTRNSSETVFSTPLNLTVAKTGYTTSTNSSVNLTSSLNLNIVLSEYVPDVTLPLVQLVYPTNTSYTINISSLNYTSSDANLQACWYSVNNGVSNTSVACGANLTGLTSTEGANTWLVGANDSSGNANSSSISFVKDTVLPTINIISPLNSTYNLTTLSFNVSLSEDADTCKFTLKRTDFAVPLDTNKVMTKLNSTWFNYTRALTDNKQYQINFTCNDTSNNLNNTVLRYFVINTSSPTSGIEEIVTNTTNETTITEPPITPPGGGGGCSSECSVGSLRCSGSDLQDCKKEYDVDPCYEWGKVETCLLGCSNNACIQGICTENWACTDWGTCQVGIMRRNCTDSNNCGTISYKPDESKICTISPLTLEYSPSELNLILPVGKEQKFSAIAVEGSDAGDIPIIVKWYADNIKLQEDAGINSVVSLFKVAGSETVKLEAVDQYSSKQVSWNIQYTNISGCKEDWVCDWSACSADGYTSPKKCIDKNACGTNADYPSIVKCSDLKNQQGNACTPNLKCTDWGNCQVDYKMSDVVKNKIETSGIQRRTCVDKAGCYDKERLEERNCNLARAVSVKTVEWCNENYVEICDAETKQIVSRIRESGFDKESLKTQESITGSFLSRLSMSLITGGSIKGADISLIVANFTGYCEYCYDNVKNYDETSVDCGGPNCPVCEEYNLRKDLSKWYREGLWVLFIVLVVVYAIYLYATRNESREKIHKKLHHKLIKKKKKL